MHPKELPNANSVVAMPTACASMVGTDLLARKDCEVAGVFGAGDQAKHHLLALKCIRKSVRKARVFSPTLENREKFAVEMTAILGIEVAGVDSPAEVVKGADVIICATNSNVPVFDGDWLVPGQHVTSIVSSNVGLLKRGFVNEMRREIDDRTLERADILMTNVWGQEELDKTAVFWEASLDRPMMARKIVDAGQLIRGDEDLFDIGWNPTETIECFFQDRAQDSHFVQQFLRARIVALSFEGEEVVVQVVHSGFEFRQIKSKSPVCLLGERPFIHEVIELDRHALAVSVAQSKAQAAEH